MAGLHGLTFNYLTETVPVPLSINTAECDLPQDICKILAEGNLVDKSTASGDTPMSCNKEGSI